MTTEKYKPAIYAALDAINRGIGAIPKGQQVNFGTTHFAFRGIDDVQAALSPLLKEHGVILACVNREVTPVGDRYLLLRATYELASLVDGSRIATESTALASLRDDRGLSAAGSVAYKYALYELFCIPVRETSTGNAVPRDNDQMAEEWDQHDQALQAAIEALAERSSGLEKDKKVAMLQYFFGVADGAGLKGLTRAELIAGTAKLAAAGK